jgi:pimeloyl-ACP methyl ester carboxylesterase
MAGDAVRLLDHLKLPRVHVVGYSMGGLITEYLLVHHPKRLHTATLGGMGWIKADDDRMALIGALAVWLDNGQQIGNWLQRFQSAGNAKASLPGPLRVLLRDDSKALAACARGMPKLAVTEEPLRANQIPTLAVIGEKDPLKVCVDDLKRVMPSLDVKIIPSGDHDTTLRSPQFPEHILTFLAAHPLTP